MLEVIEETTSQSAPPTCLAPWCENPYRLVSLWEIMLQCSGSYFVSVGVAIESIKSDCFFKTGLGNLPLPLSYLKGPIDSATIEKARGWADGVEDMCNHLGMPVCAATARDIQNSLDNPGLSYQALQASWEQLRGLIEKEMGSKVFFYITPEKLRFWPTNDKPHIFGESVNQAFPSASFDISEAGVCIAVNRPTASVFHCMRVLEIALTAFGHVFNISLAHTNWAPAIEQIESRVRDMHKDPTWKAMPDHKEQQEFYAQAASHFGILKDAWRNYTAHARGKYTEEEAVLILENTRALLRKLAKKIKE